MNTILENLRTALPATGYFENWLPDMLNLLESIAINTPDEIIPSISDTKHITI